jgi:hypothetical protein
VVAIAELGNRRCVGIDPRGRTIWAATSVSSSAAGADAYASAAQALRLGHADYLRRAAEERQIVALRRELADVAPGTIALLPPSPSGPAVNLAMRAGLDVKVARLAASDVVEPGAFGASRFRAAIYAAGEDYVHTVRPPGDAAAAVLRFVREGGALALAGPGPFPMFYAQRPGGSSAEPLTDRLGIPIRNTIETLPAEALTVAIASGQTLVSGLPRSIPYPSGDPRLRAIDRARIPAGAQYMPICTVMGATGRSYGDAAGLVTLPGGGRILYCWGGLLRDDKHGPKFAAAILRFAAAATR